MGWLAGSGRSPTSCAIGYGASAKSASTIRAYAPVLPFTDPARRMTLDRSAHAGSATVGFPFSPTPRLWMIRRCARSIGSTTSPVSLSTRVAGSGSASRKYAWQPPDPPLSISMWHGRSARNAHSRCSWPGRSTSIHRNRALAHRLLLAARCGLAPAGATNTSSPRAACRSASSSSSLEPARLTGSAAGEEVIGASACGDVQPALAPAPCCQLDQAGGVLVQHPELQRPVAFGREIAGEHAPVSEPDPAAQPFALACLRDPVGGRRWLWSSRPPCSDMASVGSRPARCCESSRFAR